MYYVYVLKSTVVNKSYVGKTNNLERRIEEHNTGKSYFTKRYQPWKCIHSEKFETENEAIMREKYLKSSAGRRWIKKLF